ncbi:hypothetical protein DL765_005771 [Monosporascus sp. GIB2]|nr:hypothetical protein DL765_005771 [Monosporascus sp. GIB2]
MADQDAKEPVESLAAVRESIEARAASEGRVEPAKEEPQQSSASQDRPSSAGPKGGRDVDEDGDVDMEDGIKSRSDGANVDANTDSKPGPDASAGADANSNGVADAQGKLGGRDTSEADAEADAVGEPEEGQVPNRLDNDMLTVIENTANYLSTYKESDGYHVAAGFQRIPNRRLIPDYHEVIKEPIAFSTIRTKKLKKQYTAFSEFVRDVALIAHNAQVYNRPSSEYFRNAARLREIFKEELQKLVDEGTITPEDAILPDLGEIPEAEDSPPPDEDDEDADEDDEDDEDDDDDDDSDDEGGRRRGRRGGRYSTLGRRSDAKDDDAHKKRGRPPKVFTPLEARIHALLKGLRRFRHPSGELLVAPFEKLPDKQATPDYYAMIKNPIALDAIKRKAKRKKYQNVDQALRDLDLMFDNAKLYNEETSRLYKDAVELQRQAHLLADQEKARPDNEFEDEDGRRPVPEIHHRGEVWRVGDWVHITNPNDLTKPIVAQIYRTWEDRSGQKWVNACWYYRPEQTVHRFEKHFLENEVVKTGQYRDHRIDEVVDRCFVMFVTRYNKGRPRGFPSDKEVYVCEARYNEEKHKLNKIKTWASCLPDEVREKDYEMDLFDVPRRLKKVPSPIKHLLRDDAKPTDPLPRPTWGAPNAPPLIGAVHCREREANESPPPEPTASPPPTVAIEPTRRASTMMQTARPLDSQGDIAMGNTSHLSAVPPPPTPTPGHTSATPYAPHFAPRPSPTPVPVPQYGQHTNAHAGLHHGSHATPPMPQTPHYQPHPPHQPPPYNGYPTQYSTTPVPVPHHPQHHVPPPHQMSTPMVPYDTTQRLAPSPARNHIAPVPNPGLHAQPNAYNPPRPIEVYQLDDALNARIPHDIREQFQCDSSGHVLFFTQPPLDRAHRGMSNESAGLGHSVRYLADRAREVEDRGAKRKARDELRREEEMKRKAAESEVAERDRKALMELAGDMFAGWIKTMDRENEMLKVAYEGWSVKDDDIDAAKC